VEAALADGSYRSIAIELNSKGVPTSQGGRGWGAAAVRQVLFYPAITGLRVDQRRTAFGMCIATGGPQDLTAPVYFLCIGASVLFNEQAAGRQPGGHHLSSCPVRQRPADVYWFGSACWFGRGCNVLWSGGMEVCSNVTILLPQPAGVYWKPLGISSASTT
jgi:Recombinase